MVVKNFNTIEGENVNLWIVSHLSTWLAPSVSQIIDYRKTLCPPRLPIKDFHNKIDPQSNNGPLPRANSL